jgi:hypothetical protein
MTAFSANKGVKLTRQLWYDAKYEETIGRMSAVHNANIISKEVSWFV